LSEKWLTALAERISNRNEVLPTPPYCSSTDEAALTSTFLSPDE